MSSKLERMIKEFEEIGIKVDKLTTQEEIKNANSFIMPTKDTKGMIYLTLKDKNIKE